MNVVINLNLNIDTNSPVGLRVNYLTNCLTQLTNIYQVVDDTQYKNSLNDCLLGMVTFIEADNIQGAIDQFDIDITEIQTYKELFFTAFGDFFENQYTPPA